MHTLFNKGTNFLGSNYPIISGAMSWVSDSALVAAVSNSGAFGVFAVSSMGPSKVRDGIRATKALTDRNFGVNVVTMHPDLDAIIDVFIEESITHAVLAGGIPTAKHIQKLKDNGINVIGFAASLIIAKRLCNLGIDALIIEGSEAGGHIGPTSTIVLIQSILLNMPNINPDIPVFVAGGIGRGEILGSLVLMGAAGIQVGTMYAASKESMMHENFKEKILKAKSRDTVISSAIDNRLKVIPVRSIHNKASEDFAIFQQSLLKKHEDGKLKLDEVQLEVEHYWAGSLKTAVIDGDISHGSLMAGQSVEFVNQQLSVEDIGKNIMQEAKSFLDNAGIK